MKLQVKNVKAIVFDLDGTLVDSMDGFSEVAQDIIHKYFNVDRNEAAQMYKNTSGLPFEFQLKSLFPGHKNISEATSEFERLKLKGYQTKTFFYDVLRALPILKQSKYKLCVSSNNHIENVKNKLQTQIDLFDLILGYQEGFLKGKDHFDKIQSEFKIGSDQMIFVGDSLHDAKAAHQNQIPFVARIGTFTADNFNSLEIPHFKIKNFFELVSLLEIVPA